MHLELVTAWRSDVARNKYMNQEKYNSLIKAIFQRFPSVQTSAFKDAYKPGLQHMSDFNALLENPDHKLHENQHNQAICGHIPQVSAD